MKSDFNKRIMEFGIFLLILLVVSVVVFIILDKTGNNPFVDNTKTKKINSEEISIKKEINTYLSNNEQPNEVGGNCFAAFKDYGSDKNDENVLYIQYYVQCYKLGENEITSLNGYSTPAKIIMEKHDKSYKVKEVVKPSESNMNSLFPKDIYVPLSMAKEDGTIKNLKDNVDKQAKGYYGDLKIN